jgi:hypothetical protein
MPTLKSVDAGTTGQKALEITFNSEQELKKFRDACMKFDKKLEEMLNVAGNKIIILPSTDRTLGTSKAAAGRGAQDEFAIHFGSKDTARFMQRELGLSFHNSDVREQSGTLTLKPEFSYDNGELSTQLPKLSRETLQEAANKLSARTGLTWVISGLNEDNLACIEETTLGGARYSERFLQTFPYLKDKIQFGSLSYIDDKNQVQRGSHFTNHWGDFQKEGITKKAQIVIMNPAAITAISKGIFEIPSLSVTEMNGVAAWLQSKTGPYTTWRVHGQSIEMSISEGAPVLERWVYKENIKKKLNAIFENQESYPHDAPFVCVLVDSTSAIQRGGEGQNLHLNISDFSLSGLLSIMQNERGQHEQRQTAAASKGAAAATAAPATSTVDQQTALKSAMQELRRPLPQSAEGKSPFLIDARSSIVALVPKEDEKGQAYYEAQYDTTTRARIYPDGRLTNSKGDPLSDKSPLVKQRDQLLQHFGVDRYMQPAGGSVSP